MKFREICEHVKAGRWRLDFCGHRCNGNRRQFVEGYEEDVAYAAGANDGNWQPDKDGKRTQAEIDAGMREFYQRRLDVECQPGEMIYSFVCPEEYCFGCGKRLHWVVGKNRLRLQGYWDRQKNDHVIAKGRCPYAKPQPTTGVITVRSRLIFANFFPSIEDSDEKDKYTDDWSLNCLHGRANITRYKAEHNIAYGQMGNMSCGVFVNDARTSIILGDPYIADRLMEDMGEAEQDAADYDALSVIEGHHLVGKISLRVWRWEATDFETIKDSYQDMLGVQDDPPVELEVPHGSWEFVHYYDTEIGGEGCVYARLRLKSAEPLA
jgi:hypothetical protein